MQFFKLPAENWDSINLYDFKPIGLFKVWHQVVMVVILYILTVVFGYFEYKQKGTLQGYSLSWWILFVPIYEEVIFRGAIFGSMLKRLKPPYAILFSSLLFGLWHFKNIFWNTPYEVAHQMAYTGLFFGPIACFITAKTRNVWWAVMFHYLNNLLASYC